MPAGRQGQCAARGLNGLLGFAGALRQAHADERNARVGGRLLLRRIQGYGGGLELASFDQPADVLQRLREGVEGDIGLNHGDEAWRRRAGPARATAAGGI